MRALYQLKLVLKHILFERKVHQIWGWCTQQKTTSNIANMSAQARVKLQLLVLAQPPVRINPLEVLVWHHD